MGKNCTMRQRRWKVPCHDGLLLSSPGLELSAWTAAVTFMSTCLHFFFFAAWNVQTLSYFFSLQKEKKISITLQVCLRFLLYWITHSKPTSEFSSDSELNCVLKRLEFLVNAEKCKFSPPWNCRHRILLVLFYRNFNFSEERRLHFLCFLFSEKEKI